MTALLKSFLIRFLRIVLVIGLFIGMAGIGTYLTLTLIIKGEDTVIVPDLVGKDVLVGLEMLSDLGLNTRVKGIRYDETVPQHHVIEQDPQPGSAIKRGRDVKIQVSRGPESIVMPNLSGLSLQQCRILLTENGLCQGVISRMHSSLYSTDQVIVHYPRPSIQVNRKKCVDLLVSQGPRPLAQAMIDLRGVSLDTALRRLEARQLNVGRIRDIPMPDTTWETIVAQTPLAGYWIREGSPVDLTVNRIPSPLPDDDRPTVSGAALFRFTLDDGILKRRVQVTVDQLYASTLLFDDFMRPGQEIWLFIPKSGNPTIRVTVDDQMVESRIMNGN